MGVRVVGAVSTGPANPTLEVSSRSLRVLARLSNVRPRTMDWDKTPALLVQVPMQRLRLMSRHFMCLTKGAVFHDVQPGEPAEGNDSSGPTHIQPIRTRLNMGAD
jgi:hypothetical protein